MRLTTTTTTTKISKSQISNLKSLINEARAEPMMIVLLVGTNDNQLILAQVDESTGRFGARETIDRVVVPSSNDHDSKGQRKNIKTRFLLTSPWQQDKRDAPQQQEQLIHVFTSCHDENDSQATLSTLPSQMTTFRVTHQNGDPPVDAVGTTACFVKWERFGESVDTGGMGADHACQSVSSCKDNHHQVVVTVAHGGDGSVSSLSCHASMHPHEASPYCIQHDILPTPLVPGSNPYAREVGVLPTLSQVLYTPCRRYLWTVDSSSQCRIWCHAVQQEQKNVFLPGQISSSQPIYTKPPKLQPIQAPPSLTMTSLFTKLMQDERTIPSSSRLRQVEFLPSYDNHQYCVLLWDHPAVLQLYAVEEGRLIVDCLQEINTAEAAIHTSSTSNKNDRRWWRSSQMKVVPLLGPHQPSSHVWVSHTVPPPSWWGKMRPPQSEETAAVPPAIAMLEWDETTHRFRTTNSKEQVVTLRTPAATVGPQQSTSTSSSSSISHFSVVVPSPSSTALVEDVTSRRMLLFVVGGSDNNNNNNSGGGAGSVESYVVTISCKSSSDRGTLIDMEKMDAMSVVPAQGVAIGSIAVLPSSSSPNMEFSV